MRHVPEIRDGEHYLRTRSGHPHYHLGYFEIVHKDNGVKGHVDPLAVADTSKPSLLE